MKNIGNNKSKQSFLSYAQAYITIQGQKTITNIAQTVFSITASQCKDSFDKRSQKFEEIEAETY